MHTLAGSLLDLQVSICSRQAVAFFGHKTDIEHLLENQQLSSEIVHR